MQEPHKHEHEHEKDTPWMHLSDARDALFCNVCIQLGVKSNSFKDDAAKVAFLLEKEKDATINIPELRCCLGIYYLFGVGGCPQDYSKAMELFRFAAEKQEYVPAMLYLMTLYQNGRGEKGHKNYIGQNYPEKNRFCKMAAQKRNRYAMERWAVNFLRAPEKEIHVYRKALEKALISVGGNNDFQEDIDSAMKDLLLVKDNNLYGIISFLTHPQVMNLSISHPLVMAFVEKLIQDKEARKTEYDSFLKDCRIQFDLGVFYRDKYKKEALECFKEKALECFKMAAENGRQSAISEIIKLDCDSQFDYVCKFILGRDNVELMDSDLSCLVDHCMKKEDYSKAVEFFSMKIKIYSNNTGELLNKLFICCSETNSLELAIEFIKGKIDASLYSEALKFIDNAFEQFNNHPPLEKNIKYIFLCNEMLKHMRAQMNNDQHSNTVLLMKPRIDAIAPVKLSESENRALENIEYSQARNLCLKQKQWGGVFLFLRAMPLLSDVVNVIFLKFIEIRAKELLRLNRSQMEFHNKTYFQGQLLRCTGFFMDKQPKDVGNESIELTHFGLKIYFDSREKASGAYGKIPFNCRDFIIYDYSNDIKVLKSNGPGTYGIYEAAKGEVGINFPTAEARKIFCEDLNIFPKEGGYLVYGKEGSNAAYIPQWCFEDFQAPVATEPKPEPEPEPEPEPKPKEYCAMM